MSTSYLRQNPCQQKCTWVAAGEVRDGGRLFHYLSCGSEWLRSEAWTPANADGVVPPEVQAERDRGHKS